jgi:hypothetical protein
MNSDRLRTLIAEADADLPARHTAPLELSRKIRISYRRRRRRQAVGLAVAAVLSAVAITFCMQNDRGAGRRQLANVAKPLSAQPLRPAKSSVNVSTMEKYPSRYQPEATPSSRPPNAYERVVIARYQPTRGSRRHQSLAWLEAFVPQPDRVDLAIEQLVRHPDRRVPDVAQPLLADRQWSEAALAARVRQFSGAEKVAAIRLLADIATPRSLGLMRQYSEFPEVHADVLRGMARLCDCASLGRLAVEERDSSLRQELLSMLLARGDLASVRTFLERVDDLQTSADALSCLRLATDAPVDALFRCLCGPLLAQRMAAARVLGRLDNPMVSHRLIALVGLGTYRQEAIVALLSSSEPTARQFLAAAARDPTLSATLWNAKRQSQTLLSWRS